MIQTLELFYLWFWCWKHNDIGLPLYNLEVHFDVILSCNHLYYLTIQYCIMAMPLTMILMLCVIPCILSYDLAN